MRSDECCFICVPNICPSGTEILDEGLEFDVLRERGGDTMCSYYVNVGLFLPVEWAREFVCLFVCFNDLAPIWSKIAVVP